MNKRRTRGRKHPPKEKYIYIIPIALIILFLFLLTFLSLLNIGNSKILHNIYINNSGQFVNQLGNNNMANIKINDEQLFALLNDKMEALKTEMQNKNCEDKIKELEEAIKNKDKKSALEIISQLAGIGSFIATGISMFL